MIQKSPASISVQVKLSFSGYQNAFGILFSKGFKRFLIFPFFALLILAFSGFSLTGKATEFVTQIIFDWFTGLSFNFWDLAWLKTISEWLLWVVFRIMFFLIFAYIGGFLVLIVLSPVLSFLSEKVEEKFTGKKQPFSIKKVINEMIRGIFVALRNIVWQLLITAIIFLLSFIPIVAPFSPILLFLVSSYFYGFAFLDYFLERSGMSISQSITWINRRKALAIALGLPFVLVISIPFLGSYLAAFFALISTIAASVAVIKET